MKEKKHLQSKVTSKYQQVRTALRDDASLLYAVYQEQFKKKIVPTYLPYFFHRCNLKHFASVI